MSNIAINFASVSVYIARGTAAKRELIAADVSAALDYIGKKSGQDAPLRKAIDAVEANAPVGKSGKISPAASRLIVALRNALTAGKLAFKRLNTGGKLGDNAQKYADECSVIVADFALEAFPPKKESEPKAPVSAIEKARQAIAALSESERTALIAELTGTHERTTADKADKRQSA